MPVCPTVQHAEGKEHTYTHRHTHMDATGNITYPTNMGYVPHMQGLRIMAIICDHI